MKRAAILTGFHYDSQADSYGPAVTASYPGITSMQDVTGRYVGATPEVYTVIVTCSDEIFTQIQNDPNFQVMWSETIVSGESIPQEMVTRPLKETLQGEKGLTQAKATTIINWLVKQGMSLNLATDLVKVGAPKADVTDYLTNYFKILGND